MVVKKVLSFSLRHKAVKNLILAVVVAIGVIIAGTIAYMNLMKLDPLDSLYFTVITIGTIGYGDMYPHTPEAKMFTIFFVLVGVSFYVYVFSTITTVVFEGKLVEVFRMENIKEEISKLRDHTILCGYGDVGEILAKNISQIVVIDKDEAKVKNLQSDDILAVVGDSTRPETLNKAGLSKAKAIIIALDSDPNVLFTILTAKELNHDIKVYARANRRESVNKMRRVGADYVVCLPELGGLELLKAIGVKS